MDFEMDSDLEDILEIDTSGHGVAPYLYEPIRRENAERCDEYDSETSSSDSESDNEDSARLHDEEDGVPALAEWCSCENCGNMPTERERICCTGMNIIDAKMEAAGLSCITHHDGFVVNCLNIHVLETAYYDHILDNGPLTEDQLIHTLYRYLAYRRFTRWVYGLLGKRNRRIIPACAVTAIRSRFPSEDYCGFSYPQ